MMGRKDIPTLPRLTSRFFNRPTVKVAKSLLGTLLVHEERGRRTSGRIVEVEAYLPLADPGCHAARGLTQRNRPMFGPPGRAYVYFCYGNHDLFNVVTERDGVPGAVLVRALEPVEGIPRMLRRRGLLASDREAPIRIGNGPGKLTQALGIGRGRHNNADLLSGALFLEAGFRRPGEKVAETTRIGITEGWDLPLRFYLAGHPALSVPPGMDRPSPGRRKVLLKKSSAR